MQGGYGTVREVEIDMQFAKENETYQMPDPKEYGNFNIYFLTKHIVLRLRLAT